MFTDGAYLFDAGWLFFAAWSLILLSFFVIAFGEDLLGDSERRSHTAAKNAPTPMRSVTSHTR